MKRRRLIVWMQRLLGVVGVACLLYWAGAEVHSHVVQAGAERRLDREIAVEKAQPPRPLRTLAAAPKDGSIIGRIQIHRLGLRAVVLQGVGNSELAVAVGHFPSTALPGKPGNCVFAAHRDSFFRPLRRIRSGDTIVVTSPSGSYRYRVRATQVVDPSDVGVLRGGRSSELTLITCYPFDYIGPAPHRFVVSASLVPSRSG